MKIEVWDNERIRFVDNGISTQKLAAYFTWITMYTEDSIFVHSKVSMYVAIQALEQYLEQELRIQPHR